MLIPRPETELLVEQALAWARAFVAKNKRPPLIADVGTGSGAIGASLAADLPEARLYASDISPAALRVARRNARRHGVADRIVFLEGNLLEPLPTAVDLVAANLPYIDEAELAELPPHIADHEPRLALASATGRPGPGARTAGAGAGRTAPRGLCCGDSRLAGESARRLARAACPGAPTSARSPRPRRSAASAAIQLGE